MRAALILLATTTTASAQDPAPDPYPKPLAPQPEPVEPPQQPQGPVLQLSAVDAAILERGEIDPSVHYGGILANVVIGFGLGQAIQGRWLAGGWKFTAGMGAGFAVFFASADNSKPLAIVGGIAAAGFWIWGIADAVAAPMKHNRRWRELRQQLGLPLAAIPYVSRSGAGLLIRF